MGYVELSVTDCFGMSRLGMLNGYLVGIKPRGAAFSLTLRRGRSYIRRGTQDVPGFARIFCTVRTFRKQASGLLFRHKNARLCSRAHPACCVCDPVGIRTQDPQLRRLLLYPAELPDPESFGWARTPCCTLLGTERRLFPECGCKDRKIFTFPNFFHNFTSLTLKH